MSINTTSTDIAGSTKKATAAGHSTQRDAQAVGLEWMNPAFVEWRLDLQQK